MGGSPGTEDPSSPRPGSIQINEILAHSHDEAPDWIELKNTSENAIDIGGWYLSDEEDELQKYEIASGTIIPAGGLIVFNQSDHFGNSDSPGSHDTFALSENGESVLLSSSVDGELSGYRINQTFGASETGVSMGRHQKSTGEYEFTMMSITTPGAPNALPLVGPIIITEIMYHPTSIDLEFIEIYNTSNSPIELYDEDGNSWKFSNGIHYTFPSNTTIQAHEYLIIPKNVLAFTEHYSPPNDTTILGPFSGQLNNAGETLSLSMPGDEDDDELQYILVDTIRYRDESPWPSDADGEGKSLQRINHLGYSNDVAQWTSALPTPGE